MVIDSYKVLQSTIEVYGVVTVNFEIVKFIFLVG